MYILYVYVVLCPRANVALHSCIVVFIVLIPNVAAPKAKSNVHCNIIHPLSCTVFNGARSTSQLRQLGV